MKTELQIRDLSYCRDSRRLFSRIEHLPGSFLLYSAQGFARERFDVLSALPARTLQIPAGSAPDPTAVGKQVEQMIQALTQHQVTDREFPLPGWYGLLGYDLFHGLHGLPREAAVSVPTSSLEAGFYPVIVISDHVARRTCLIALPGHEDQIHALLRTLNSPAQSEAGEFRILAPFTANLSRESYRARFERIQLYLHDGDCYQVNLAQRFTAPYTGSTWSAFMRLSGALPAPMSAYFSGAGHACLSLSPERFLSVKGGLIRTHPIKGTRPRSPDPDVDALHARELQNSPKDRAENLMIVDLLRNDLGLSCIPGSIRVTDLFAIESFANVHHLVSTIEGRLRPEIHPLQALIRAFPGGSITGAPKRRAMEIIAELEPDNRSFYCGSAFYCDVGGKLDSSILIRTLVAHEQSLYCWGGGGVVVDSTWEQEYQETLDKVGLLLSTLSEP